MVDAAVDRVKAENVNVPVGSVFGTLQAYLGSYYVNQFNKFGRTYQVYVQADSRYRLEPDDIRRLHVRNAKGQMVPLGTMTDVSFTTAPAVITLYNLFPAAPINGMAAPGYSSGQALADHGGHGRARSCPPTWVSSGRACPSRRSSSATRPIYVFAIASLMVFLVLAAQYESWTDPAAVILVVPLAMLGTVLALIARHFDNNVYTQIGLVLLIALAAKNAILIVEYGARAAGPRHAAHGGGGRGLAPAAAADPHDLLRLHPRRAAARTRHGRRRRQPAGARHGRDRRHAAPPP